MDKNGITKEQAITIKSAFEQHMAIEWQIKNMTWITYRIYPSIISICSRAINAPTSDPVKQISYNVRLIELNKDYLLIQTDGPIIAFLIRAATEDK